jgi:hypothetical protein
MRAAPDFPALMFAQAVSTSAPTGVTSPSPVTTTRRMAISSVHLSTAKQAQPMRAEPVEALYCLAEEQGVSFDGLPGQAFRTCFDKLWAIGDPDQPLCVSI